MAAALSSALRKDSLDFRTDGNVRCKLAVSEDSKALFSGVAGAKVTLAGIAHPTSDFEAATKYYVDTVASGLTVKGSVQYAVTGNLEAQYSEDRMSLVGTGAFSALSAATFDLNPANGETIAQQTASPGFANYAPIAANVDELVATRFLVKGQTDKKRNGAYFLEESTATGWTLRRCANFNDDPSGEIKAGSFVFVTSGYRHVNHGFVLVSDEGEKTLRVGGATPNDLQFEQFSGAGQVSAGTNLNKTGDTINLNANVDVTDVHTDTITARQHAEFNSTVHVDGASTFGSTLGVTGKITAMAEDHKIANFTVNNGSIVSSSGALSIGSNSFTAGGAATLQSTLAVTGATSTAKAFLACTSATAPTTTIGEISDAKLVVAGAALISASAEVKEDFYVGGGIAVSNSLLATKDVKAMLSLYQEGTDAYAWFRGHTKMFNDTEMVGPVTMGDTLDVTGKITALAQDHKLADFTVNNGSIVSSSGALSIGSNTFTAGGAATLQSTLSVTGATSLNAPATVSAVAKLQDKTFIGCGAVQPSGAATRRTWATARAIEPALDENGDPNPIAGTLTWAATQNPETSHEATLVVGGASYFDGNIHMDGAFAAFHAHEGILLSNDHLTEPNRSTSIELLNSYVKVHAEDGIELHGGSITQLDSKQNLYRGSAYHMRPVLISNHMGEVAGTNSDVQLEREFVDGAWTEYAWVSPAAPAVGYEYGNSVLVADGKAYVTGQLVVAGDDGLKVRATLHVDGATSLNAPATVSAVAKLHDKTFIGCGALQPSGAGTRRTWETDKGTAPNWNATLNPETSHEATLVVGGHSYFDGEMLINAGNNVAGASGVMDTKLSLTKTMFEVITRQTGDGQTGQMTIALANGAFNVAGVDVMSIYDSGIYQDSGTRQNVYMGHTAQRRPMRIENVDVHSSVLEYDYTNHSWTGPAYTANSSDDYTNASLVVDGKAYVNGRLVVAGDAGAVFHGDVALDNKLLVTNAITATAQNHQLADFTVNNGSIVSTSGALSIGTNSLTVGGAATLQSTLAVTSAITAEAQNHKLADFTINNGSIVSASPTISHGSNNVTTTGDISSTNMSFTTQLSGATATFTADCTAQNFYATSDVILKHEIRPIERAVAQCQKLRGVEFKWKHGEDKRDQMGVIAQEVEEVYPSLVAEIDGHKRVDYSKLVGLLIEAVKELKDETSRLHAESAELRAEIADLRAQPGCQRY